MLCHVMSCHVLGVLLRLGSVSVIQEDRCYVMC